MKRAQIKKSWVVYPPNYFPGHDFFKKAFLKDARNKALSLGKGAKIVSCVDKVNRFGLKCSHTFGAIEFEVK